MDDIVIDFIRAKQINSFQKLRFLLYLEQHPDFCGTGSEFAKRLHLGDVSLLEKIIDDLQQVDVLINVGQHWKLTEAPEIGGGLRRLARAFENPVTRQGLLTQVSLLGAASTY